MGNLSRKFAKADVKKKAMPAPWKNCNKNKFFTIHRSSGKMFNTRNQKPRFFMRVSIIPWILAHTLVFLSAAFLLAAFFVQKYG